MKYFTLSHCGGDQVISEENCKIIASAITAVPITLAADAEKFADGTSTKIRQALLSKLKAGGWSSKVKLAADSEITITSVKDDIGLCLQTGNMSRLYADLLKLQAMYLNNSILGAIIIVPSQDFSKLIGSNIAQARRLQRELTVFKKAYHVPTLIFALEM